MCDPVEQITWPPAILFSGNHAIGLKDKVSQQMCQIESQKKLVIQMYHTVQYPIIARLCAIAKTLLNELFQDQNGFFHLPKESPAKIPRRR